MTKSIHPIAPLSVLAATLLLASPALAQTARPGEQLGMRYLSWAGKPAGSTNDGLRRASDLAPQVQAASLAAATPAPATARPNRYGSVSSNSLTPASAWISPRSAPAAQAQAAQVEPPQAQPEHQAAPVPEPRRLHAAAATAPVAQPQSQTIADAPQYDPSRAIRRQDPYYGAPPETHMAMQPTPQPVPMPPPPPLPATSELAADPMAPRRDALIFRMGGSAPQARPAAQPAVDAPHQLAQSAPVHSDAPARQGARYYSVHREAGHQPDPMTLPESVFIGGSADLAEPPPAPVVQRTVNGRAQVLVANQDPALP